jgi:formamidopyrimidine-DNA glycosylase
MPELPEVENRLIYFRREALGQRLDRVTITAPNIIKQTNARTFASALRGRKFVGAQRRGKYLIITLDNDRLLILHFGMGGDLLVYRDPRERPPFTRIEFIFERGRRMAFTCPRKICRVMLVDSLASVPALNKMGREPLDKAFSLAYLERVIEESPSRQIKPLLMDQKKIAGVGNIYADEVLFAARVRPDRRAGSLTEEEIKRVHREVRRVLRLAIKTGGDENFPSDFLVSRSNRAAACKVCGEAIEKKTIAGRTAYFCSRCQA